MQRLAVSTIPAKACQAGLRHVSNPIRHAAYCLHLRKQVTEALLAGWMLGDDRAPRLLSLSRSRLVGGAVVTEAYESAKLTAVRPQFFLVVETIFNLQPTTPLSLTSVLLTCCLVYRGRSTAVRFPQVVKRVRLQFELRFGRRLTQSPNGCQDGRNFYHVFGVVRPGVTNVPQ